VCAVDNVQAAFLAGAALASGARGVCAMWHTRRPLHFWWRFWALFDATTVIRRQLSTILLVRRWPTVHRLSQSQKWPTLTISSGF